MKTGFFEKTNVEKSNRFTSQYFDYEK